MKTSYFSRKIIKQQTFNKAVKQIDSYLKISHYNIVFTTTK